MGARWGLGLAVVLAGLAVGCSSNRGGAPAPAACVPTTCQAEGKNCGVISDGCGGLLGCGGCVVGQSCGGSGVDNVCGISGCSRATCASLQAECGHVSDGCGGTLDCGLCANGQSCGAGGRANVCAASGVGAGVRACSKDGFCWMTPSPAGLTFRATWGAASNDFWAVGEVGYVAHWDGARLALLPMDRELRGVWGSAPDDVWAVGDGVVHWNGRSWSAEGSLPGEVLRAVSGSAADDVWAVGDNGRVLHWNGHDWQPVDSGTQLALQAVWANGPRDVWAAGDAGEVLHFDGSAWTEQPKLDTPGAAAAIWSSPGGDVWVSTPPNGMYRWNGSSWQVQREAISPVLGAWGSAAGPWFVGRQGSVLARRDGAWSLLSQPPVRVDGAFAASASDVWFVSSRSQPDSTFTHWDGGAFSSVTNPFGPGGFQALGGSSASDLWAVGDADFVGHFDGKTWTRVETGLRNLTLTSVWASGPADAWAVGFLHDTNAGLTLHWNGRSWGRSIAGSFNSVWGSSSHDVWAVGPRSVAHFDGAAWSFLSAGAGRFPFFASVWGSGPGDVWAVGSDPDDPGNQIWRWNGTTWARVAHPDLAPGRQGEAPALHAVWGTGPNDVYAVGTGGGALHWDGQAWSRIDAGLPPGSGEVLKAVMTPGTDVWLGGRDGAILRRQGR